MPFKLLSDVAKKDDVVKFLFDNVRNLGLIALVYGAGRWKFDHISEGSGFDHYFGYFLGCLLYVTAWCLFFINSENTVHKIRALEFPRWVKAILGGLHSSLILQIFIFTTDGKLFT
jgi:hypothetical protein